MENLSFEVRCQLAISYLKDNMADYKSVSTETPTSIRELLIPEPDDSPVIAELKSDMLKSDAALRKDFAEKLAETAWKSCISLSNALHGADATEFAVKAIEYEGKKTAN